ncbi:hypothetical protein B0H17DRAFT_1191521 [Mycena rosella]|uniref:Uncharacterized protein n=1 Tax=Mycena rosella TaxID=1033263 RepID=A0AAD7MB95_MYCRO|nr:hypothetical protein B0H17DRAFT_1191521 [Mycena rosella]
MSSPVSWTPEVTDPVNWTSAPGPVTSLPPRTVVTIELVQPSSSSLSGVFTPAAVRSPGTTHQRICLEYPAEIENTGPVVTFSTPRKVSTVNHYSHFQVLIGDIPAHSESTALVLTSSASPTHHTYSTELIPQFWAYLCGTAQLFQCVIQQDIMKTSIAFDVVPAFPLAGDQSIRSVTYDFSTPPPTKPVFFPPSLRSEPPLPPGFPGVSYSSRFITPTVAYPKISAPSPGPTHPPSIGQPSAFYGWNSAEVTDGLFSGTAFYHTDETHAIPSFYSLPDFHPSAFHTEDTVKQWQDLNHNESSSISYYSPA